MSFKSTSTVKEYVEKLLMATSFVDIHGRNIGYDYGSIVRMIKLRFPKSRVSRRVLKDWYSPNLQQTNVRLPSRRRTRSQAMAVEFTRAQLLKRVDGVGLRVSTIQRNVRRNFPGLPSRDLRKMERHLKRKGYVVPERPE